MAPPRDTDGMAIDLDRLDDDLWKSGTDLDWFEPGSYHGPKPKKKAKKASSRLDGAFKKPPKTKSV